jgi:hypothetical protein
MVYASSPNYLGSGGRRIAVQGQSKLSECETLSEERTGGVTQVVEHLLRKHEALSSNPQYGGRGVREREREKLAPRSHIVPLW